MNTAEYLIVQHISDLFRRESRNVGVIVRIKGETSGRFYGEIELGKIDGRQTRDLPFPGIYAQWVRYWHRILSTKNGSAWDEILSSTTGNYQVLNGGSVDRIGEDSINEVTQFLYDALVSEGGIASALGAPGKFQRLRHPIIRDAHELAGERIELERTEARMNMCLDNMEGADAAEFARWEKLAEAYRVIVEDMKAEIGVSTGTPGAGSKA